MALVQIRLDKRALAALFRNIARKTAEMHKQAAAASDAGAAVFYGAVRTNLSLSDHTPAALAAVGRPYARSGGATPRLHLSPTSTIASGGAAVHTQSGALLAALRMRRARPGSAARVYLDETRAPHARAVVEGTRVMVPRPVLTATAAAPEVREAMLARIRAVLSPVVR